MAAIKLRRLLLGRKLMTNLDSILKRGHITLPTKVHLVKAMVFPVVMYGYESWTVKKAERRKNWCFWTVVLEKTLESLLDCKVIQPVHPERDQSWVFIGRTDAEAETPILWPPHKKSWLIGKDPDAGRDWGQEEKGMTEDEMAGWHHQLDGIWVNKLQELVMDREPWCAGIHGVAKRHDWVTELNWVTVLSPTELNPSVPGRVPCAGDTVVEKYNLWQSSGRYRLLEAQFCTRQDMLWHAYGCSEKRGRGEDGRKGMPHVLRFSDEPLAHDLLCSHRLKPRKFCRSWAMCRKYFTGDKWVWWSWQPDRLAQCNPWPPILSPPQNGCHQKSASPPPWVSYLGRKFSGFLFHPCSWGFRLCLFKIHNGHCFKRHYIRYRIAQALKTYKFR